jgi:chorismate mutase-like protein
MKQIRNKIDAIDKKLIALLAKRKDLVVKLGEIKKQKNIPVQDDKREAEMLLERAKLAKKHGLNPLLIKRLYAEIINESKRIQSHEK